MANQYPAEESLKRREAALAHIARRPGISQDELAIALGLSPRTWGERNRRNAIVARLIHTLEAEGLICAQRDRFAKSSDPLKLYPADWEPPKKQSPQPASDRHNTECKVYTVPLEELYKYTSKPSEPQTVKLSRPVKIRRTEEPAAMPETPEVQRRSPRSTEEVRAAIEDALTEFMAKGVLFTQRDIMTAARTSGSVLARHQDLVAKIRAGIKQMKKRARTPLDPVMEAIEEVNLQKDTYTQKLEQEVARLQTEKALLEQQLQTQPQSPLVVTLRQECDRWQSRLEAYRKQQQELEGAIDAAKSKIELLESLIESQEQQLEAEIKPASNGHYKLVGGAA